MSAPEPLVSSSVLGPEISVVPDDDPGRLELRRWLADNSPGVPEPLDQDEKVAFRREWQRTLFRDGWAGPAWPERYGGRGAGALVQFMYYEELALARAPEPVNTPGLLLIGPTLMVHGSDELKERFLPGILSGDDIWCQGFSEPDAGSDLASLRARAVLDGDSWTIDGQKIWTTWAQYSNWCFVLCRTDPESSRHRGLTLLICEMDDPGIEVRPIVQISGDPEFAEVFFDGARTPADLIVGTPGEGWAAAMTMFQFERADQGFTDHGRLLVELADLGSLLARLGRDGELSAAALDSGRRRIADLWIRCQQLRRLNLRAAMRVDAGEQIGPAGSVTNLVWGEIAKDVATLAVELRGAEGLIARRHCSHQLLAARAASIYSGTSEIQRNIIAERLVGLPR